jgi:hypothetical protein
VDGSNALSTRDVLGGSGVESLPDVDGSILEGIESSIYLFILN